MKILHLTLHRKWFDMIVSGEKKEEYREIKPYWDRRLSKEYDAILFKNGYQKNAPSVLVELLDVTKGQGWEDLGAPRHEVYVLRLGRTIEVKNYERT